MQNGDKQISRNGITLLDLIATYDLTVISNGPVRVDKWARINATTQNQKSILAYVIWTSSLLFYIQEMIIDEDENHKLKGKNQCGHNIVILTISKNLNQKNKRNKI